ncbi:tetratricopeptide repeat protein [Prochlorococcus marinus]|uniref:tetratricopeptide repeat protein n=1 Tax=Prochlorococcus marinus TaxID=1219 RepID=UPI0022B576FA|nr:tetratricopeptide repeat protein [Prochlorococcus marinus]
MEGPGKQNFLNKQVTVFPVPLSIEDNQENISISSDSYPKLSKEEIRDQAFNFHSKGDLSKAKKYYQCLFDQDCNDPRVFSNYGNILKDLRQYEESVKYQRKAIKLKPDYTLAHYNLGIVLCELGQFKEAEISYRKAIKINPNFSEAYLNLGTILKKLGDFKEAEILMKKGIEINPNYAEIHSNLGIILTALGKPEEAILSTSKAIDLRSDLIEPYSNMGNILEVLGRENEAYKYYSIASQKAPNDIHFFINANLRFSPIMKSNEQIDNERIQYKNSINKIKINKEFHIGKIYTFNSNCIFYLAYQNRKDDKEILEDFSNTLLMVKGMEYDKFSLSKYFKSSHKRESLKIGICSQFLNDNHTVGKLYINVLIDLLKTDLDVTVYLPPETNKSSGIERIKTLFKKIIYLPESPQVGAKVILSDNLDLLFYPEIGMSSYCYILAMSKLALVQVTSLGHANTSGIKNIDYFITYGLEPASSDSSYSEKLKRFRRLPFNYSAPKINESNLRNLDIINPKNKFLIGLTQSLFKIHPSYDEILESILINIDNSYFILLKDKCDYNTKVFQDRWRNKNKLLIERSIFLDRMSIDDFMNTTRSFHIMLDPFYFGSGNTFYEAMVFGIPFITYPHNQKTKIASAGYAQMKVDNPPIAKSPQDYINWCKLYSKNDFFLKNTKKELIEKAQKYLFNDSEIYKDYYNFFNEAIENGRKESSYHHIKD